MARSRIVNLENLQQFTAINVLSDPGHIGGPVIVPQCAQIVIRWALTDGKFGNNILYGRYSGGFAGTVAQANAIMSGLSTGAQWTALATFMGTLGGLFGVTIRNVSVANQPVISSTNANVPGTTTGTALPDETAATITLRTAFTGPQNRGRMFIPNWASNAIGAGGVIAPAAVTALQNWANTIPGVLSGQGYTWVIGQPARAAYVGSTGTSHPARAATSQAVTSQPVRDNHWDSSRRRGLK